jgi:hypothetical protein
MAGAGAAVGWDCVLVGKREGESGKVEAQAGFVLRRADLKPAGARQ